MVLIAYGYTSAAHPSFEVPVRTFAPSYLKSYQLEAAVARAEQGKKDYAKLVSAVDQVVAADVDIERIRSDTDRMRRAYESRLRKASAAACNAEQAAVARCEKLLRESVGLIEEGRSLLLRNAAVHYALVSTNIK